MTNTQLLSNNNYLLPVGKDDDDRLCFEWYLLFFTTNEHVSKYINSETIIVDAECSNGMTVTYFLDKVKTIYAIDSSAEQLELTRSRVEKFIESSQQNFYDPESGCLTEITPRKFAKVHYIQANITEEFKLPEPADVVFLKFGLSHINTNLHSTTINNLMSNLKVGGVLLNEEPITRYDSNVESEIFNSLFSLIDDKFANVGNDASIGDKLEQVYADKGKIIECCQTKYYCNLADCKRLCLLSLPALRYGVSRTDVLDRIKELSDRVENMNNDVETETYFYLGVATIMKV